MYIQFSKDINKIRNTVVWLLTFRDVIIAAISTVIGLAVYFCVKEYIGFEAAGYALCAFIILPSFFIFYRKNGMSAEKIIKYKLKRVITGKIRPYKTENLYAQLEKEIKKYEVNKIAVSDKSQKQNTNNKKAKKQPAQNSAAKPSVPRHEKRRNLHGKK